MPERSPALEDVIDGTRYRCRSLCAVDQWHLLQQLQPILPASHTIDAAFVAAGATLESIFASLQSLRTLSDEAIDQAFAACLGAVEKQDGDAWGPVPSSTPLTTFMALLRMVVIANFVPFFTMERPKFTPVDTGVPSFRVVTMPGDQDWLWRPVLRRLCKAESLWDGTFGIEHVALLNTAIDVSDENNARAHLAVQKAKP